MATDPVCKMEVNPAKATAQAPYAGQTYYFCSESCHRAFTAEPRKYLAESSSSTQDKKHRHCC